MDKNSSDDSANDDDNSGHEEVLITEETETHMIYYILAVQSFPVIFNYVVSMGSPFATLYFAGRFVVDDNKTIVYAGISLGLMLVNVSARSILIGLSSALDTLASQHNGAKNYAAVGILLQRCIVILMLVCIPVAIGWQFAEDFFLYLGLDSRVCAVIGVFMKIRTAELPIVVLNESYEKYLVSVGVMTVPMIANIALTIVLIGLNVIFINVMDLDYEYLAWAIVISEYFGCFCMVALSYPLREVQRTLQPWTWELFHEWREFFELGLPGMTMLCSEWWAFEVLVMWASLLGTEEVAAQTVIFQVSSLAFMVPLGLAITSTSIVGNTLGAGKKELGIRIGNCCLRLAASIQLMLAALIVSCGSYFVAVFAQDTKVRNMADELLPYQAVFTLFDGVQGVASGIFRGAGKQVLGAGINVAAYYAFGLPLAYCLCFYAHLGVAGLVAGIASATVLQCLSLLALLYCYTDYIYTIATSVANVSYIPVGDVEEGMSSLGSLGDTQLLASVVGNTKDPVEDWSDDDDFVLNKIMTPASDVEMTVL